jgi:hypothetical protein
VNPVQTIFVSTAFEQAILAEGLMEWQSDYAVLMPEPVFFI